MWRGVVTPAPGKARDLARTHPWPDCCREFSSLVAQALSTGFYCRLAVLSRL